MIACTYPDVRSIDCMVHCNSIKTGQYQIYKCYSSIKHKSTRSTYYKMLSICINALGYNTLHTTH